MAAVMRKWTYVLMFGLLEFLSCLILTDTAHLNLVILHTNDILSHYKSFNETFGNCREAEIISTTELPISTTETIITTTLPTNDESSASTDGEEPAEDRFSANRVSTGNTGECFGGLARLVTKSRELTAEDDDNTVFLFLNSGNTFGETIWHPILGWEPAAYSVEKLGYDVMSLGVREFEDGVGHLTKYLEHVKNVSGDLAVVGANIAGHRGDLDKYITHVHKVGEKKNIGIIGYTSVKTEYMSDPGSVKFTDEVEAVKKEAEKLMQDNVNIIIALGSAGFETAKRIADEVESVDIVVSGGDETFLYTPHEKPPSTEEAKGDYPYEGRKSLIVQTYPYGKYIGYLNVTFNEDGIIVRQNPNSNPVLLSTDVPPDPEVAAQVKKWASKVAETEAEVVGSTRVNLIGSREECWKEECNMGNLMTDAAVWYIKRYLPSRAVTEQVNMALWHSSTISQSISRDNRGTITVGDIFRAFPYHNTLYTVELQGKELKALFEEAVAGYKEKGTMKFLQVSGIRVSYDIRQSPGSRVTELLFLCVSCSSAEYQPVEEKSYYRLAVPSYLAHGGMFDSMKDKKGTDTEVLDDDILKAYINAMSPVTTGKEGRIKFVTAPSPIPTCESSTKTVFVTLLVVAVIGLAAFLVYKYIYPRFRRRYGSSAVLVH